MCSKRDTILFLAGALGFYTLTHLALMYSRLLPFRIYGIPVTVGLNNFSVLFGAIGTMALLWWANNLAKQKSSFWKWW
jgi:hypothetical protein